MTVMASSGNRSMQHFYVGTPAHDVLLAASASVAAQEDPSGPSLLLSHVNWEETFSLSVEKTVDFDGDGTYGDAEAAEMGSVAHWRIVVANTGTGDLLAVGVADSNGHAFGPPFPLDAGDSRTFAYDTTPTEDTVNVATAWAGRVPPVTDDARVRVLPHPPVLSVDKTVDYDGDGTYGKSETALLGSTAHWRIVVSNTGLGDEPGATLTDSNGHAFGGAFALDAGESMTFD